MPIESGPSASERSNASDIAIIRRVLDGEVNAFEALLQKYQDYVFKVVARQVPYEEVADTAQDVFIRAYRSLPAFQAKGSFAAWLKAIAIRTSYDYLRKRYRCKEEPLSSFSESHAQTLEFLLAESSGAAFEIQAQKAEIREIMDRALNKMSAEDRMVIDLVYLQGLSGKETAKLLGWSVANVKVRSFRCRKKLKNIITQMMEA